MFPDQRSDPSLSGAKSGEELVGINRQHAIRKDAGSQTAVSLERFVCARAKSFVHPVAGCRFFGTGKGNPLNFELGSNPFIQIEALVFENDVSPEHGCILVEDSELIAQGLPGGMVEESNLALVVLFVIEEPVSTDSLSGNQFDLIDRLDFHPGRALAVTAVVVVLGGNVETANFHSYSVVQKFETGNSRIGDYCPVTMAKGQKNAISPTRDENFPEWYQQVVRAADLAENSEVRGCMVIKPWGYGLWERIQQQMDRMFKETGHKNAYFPLLIPVSYLEKEATHVEGFATECAVVTHHRLELQDGKMVPSGELTEPYVIRPTSETIIGAAFARWVQSYRDLPLLINQWANVMRWEMRPRLFLRTAEFLWQEGHTAHETADEAMEETRLMHRVYEDFLTNHLAVPVIAGEKTEAERFPGALNTFTVEAMVQDRKAIQAGTSHFLGQNFSKAAGIEFEGREGKREFAWTTSWGVSTRMIGTLLMAHSDDDGLVLPPRVAPTHVVILPVVPKPEHEESVFGACEELAARLQELSFHGDNVTVEIDKRDIGGGVKNWEWIKKGVPVRIEIGPRDLEKGSVAVVRRDKGPKDKAFLPTDEAVAGIVDTLQDIQDNLLARAREFRDSHLVEISSMDEFRKFFTPENSDKPEIHGGFALVPWGGTAEDEEALQKELKVTVRCIPDDATLRGEAGTCIYTGKPAEGRVIFAKSY